MQPRTRLLRTVCSYCDLDMGSKPSAYYEGEEMISHGICGRCMVFVVHDNFKDPLPEHVHYNEFLLWKIALEKKIAGQAAPMVKP